RLFIMQIPNPAGYIAYTRGDLNHDGHVNASDIPLLERALANPHDSQLPADLTDPYLFSLVTDVNGDGSFNNFDLQALIKLFKTGHGSADSVPEPNSLVLLFLAIILLPFARRNSFCSVRHALRA